ncbi:hypothetical protein T492DRAFT_957725, partial [Pavlovales sp. CCMP2436]
MRVPRGRGGGRAVGRDDLHPYRAHSAIAILHAGSAASTTGLNVGALRVVSAGLGRGRVCVPDRPLRPLQTRSRGRRGPLCPPRAAREPPRDPPGAQARGGARLAQLSLSFIPLPRPGRLWCARLGLSSARTLGWIPGLVGLRCSAAVAGAANLCDSSMLLMSHVIVH